MALTVGTRLGVYDVTAQIGEGGMGQVYRARDTTLNRDVALKVLPDAFASDPDRLARFTREAQTLGSLNHPNIAHIHGLEESGGVRALVMELVEGEDLSQRITHGAIPLDEALPIAKQIAEALEAAHEQGITHRDVKPANIKVRADGTVKVLDFGLAKAMDPAGAASGEAMNSSTMTSPAMTAMGMILGTAAYMSPEQAKGRAADKRADIWAFGVVLYEMLSGRRAFEGEDVSDLMVAVLSKDVDLGALPAGTPPSIVSLIRRCLARDPKKRLRDIGEARLVLDHPDAGPVSSPVRARSRFGLMHVVSAVLLVALLASVVVLWPTSRAQDEAAVRLSVGLPIGMTLDVATRPAVAISPDGSKVVFAAGSKGVNLLYLRRIGKFDLEPLSGTDGAMNPFFSPDGEWIGFFAGLKLKKVPTEGGPVVKLADVDDPRGGAWLDRATIVYSPKPATPLMRVAADGGTPTPVAPLDEQKHERTHRWPSALPDGKTVLFTVGSIEQPDDYDEASIEAVRVDTGTRTFLLKGRMPRYLPTGHLLFTRGKLLYAVPFDPVRLATHGSPVAVVDGVSGDATTGAAQYGAADNGTIVFVPGDPTGPLHVPVWMDLKGTVTPIDVPEALYSDPRVAPDGRRLAVSIVDNTGARDIHVIDTTRGTSFKFTYGGINRTPIWSRGDGKTLYYVAYDPAKSQSTVFARAADQSGTAEPLREFAGQVYLDDISLDNTALAMRIISQRSLLWRMSLTNPTAEPALLLSGQVPGGQTLSAVSPDGRWIAYVSTETGRSEVFVHSFTTGARLAQVSSAGGTEPHWSADGRMLYYFQVPDQLMAVPIDAGTVFARGKPRTLLGGLTRWSVDTGQTYHVSPVGDRFLMMRPATEHATPELRVVFNWLEELKARAPINKK